MFAKGPLPGACPKEEALKVLPVRTTCKRLSGGGNRIVKVPKFVTVAHRTPRNPVSLVRTGHPLPH